MWNGCLWSTNQKQMYKNKQKTVALMWLRGAADLFIFMKAARLQRAARFALACRKARQFRASPPPPHTREENILAGNEAAAVVTFSPPAIYYCSPHKSLQPIRFIWAYHPAGILYQLPSSHSFAAPSAVFFHLFFFFCCGDTLPRRYDDVDTCRFHPS